MKKLLTCMTMIAAMAVMTVSCSKDDDKDTPAQRLEFANKLTMNGTTATWEGTDQRQFKELGNWVNKSQSYVVIRFDRNSTTDTQGTGVVLTFQNSYKEDFKERSEFTWNFNNDQLHINYRRSGWQPVYAEYRTNELIIDNSGFKGFWFESTDTRYQFSYIKSNFTDWDKYKD